MVLVVILEQMWEAIRLTLTMRLETSEVGLLLLKVPPKAVEKLAVKTAVVTVVLQLVWKILHLAVMTLEPRLVSSGVVYAPMEATTRLELVAMISQLVWMKLILVVVKLELGPALLVLKGVLVEAPVKHPNVLSVVLHP
ncbi:hypothetical protein JG687_00005214 [Phytophthora cactorum]|uniref:Uncharacterized protein n=1 Tax=Phytophthora cactorum TaxID=29920 RepID=A0A8T1UR70_9STRA|nr:hypothetical protein JG687_00005214 [Phytophthora cactorum]